MLITILVILFGCFALAYGNAMNKLVLRRQTNMWAWEKKSEGYKADHKMPTLMTKSYKQRAYICMAVGLLIILAGAVPLSFGYTLSEAIALL